MVRYLTGALVLLFALAGISAAAQIQWLHSIEEGLKAAQKTPKPLMVEAYTDT